MSRLSIQDFGAHLLRTGDLDPVYIALYDLEGERTWSQEQVKRWLVAYWCFYDCGFASWASELEEMAFWKAMTRAAINDRSRPAPVTGGRWPRGRERRHFRGKAATSSVASLRERYPEPEEMVHFLVRQAPDYKALSKAVQSHVGFGPWIGFKVADMIDRLGFAPVDFTEAAVFMFKDPVKAAIMYWNQSHTPPFPLDTEWDQVHVKQDIIPNVVAELTHHFKDVMAPPAYERPVGLQEVETILCKWKSHMNGHYPLNNDIREIRHGVKHWAPFAESAADFLAALPEVGP